MERYRNYRESGISWMKDIPNHWEERRIGALFTDQVFANSDFAYKHAFKFNYGTLVPKNEIGDEEEFRETYIKYSVLKKNDIVINGLNLNYDFVSQRVAIAPSDGIITSAYLAMRPRQTTNANYYLYVLKTMDNKKMFHGMGTGIRLTLSFDELKKQILPAPPIAEQEKIVNYLDSKTLSIDAYVAERERELQLLNELKQAEIANVVTQGLNPDVKMKESKTPFFGLIPEHWEERKMKYCFSERSEKNHPEEPILCATQSQGVIPQSMYQNRVVVVNKGFEGLKFVKVGDFVISLRSFEGGIEYAYYQGIISAAYTILTPNNSDNADYFKLLFKSYPFIQVLQTCVTGIREGQNINYQMLGRQFIPMPPIDEQCAIVTYVEDKCAKVNTLIAELEAEIEYIKEYKQRLIADCVTGQVNVQNVNNKTNVI